MRLDNRKTQIIIGASILIVGLLLGWLIFGGTGRSTEQEPDHAHGAEMADETIWTCSMHPQIRQPDPGDCPICGMDLIPLENEENEEMDPAAISMSPTAMQLADISTAIVNTTQPVKEVQLNGKVHADERLVFSQSSHIPGRIEKLLVNFTGEYVQKGQNLAFIYSPELETAQEELFEAQKIKETQPQLFEAAKEKLKNWKLSDERIEQILQEGTPLEEFAIRADVSGYVTQKMVNPGDYVTRGEAIYEIADLSKVWVLFDVYESDIPWVNKGDKVNFTVASLPGQTFEGNISYIDPVINPTTRVSQARVEYRNSSQNLKPEMFASGTIEAELEGVRNAIVIPKSSVMWTGERSVVYVRQASEKGINFVMREVVLGPSLGNSYLIESGLSENEEIATNGTFSIDAAAQLAGKPSMMNPEGGVVSTGHNHGNMDMGTSDLKEGQEIKEQAKEVNPLTINKQAEEALQPLYTAYLEWKDALTNDNFEEAQKMATNMKSALDKIDMGIFKGDAHNAWMDFQASFGKSLEHVQHFSDIEELREAFQTVSATMIEMTNAFTPLSETIYVQHCPMADNDKGADWLSKEQEIRNPYFGSSMLTCGEITKEIK